MTTVETTKRALPSGAEFEAIATRQVKLGDFGEPYFREGLDVLLNSLASDVIFTFIGRMMLRRAILTALDQRLRLVDLEKREPERLRASILPPLIVTGLPRSGTTYFHRLLAEDPRLYAPPLWHMLAPVLPKGTAGPRLHRMRLKAELAVFNRLAPSLDAKHVTRADEPEECIFLTAPSFRSPIFWSLTPVTSYLEWYATCDRRQKYVEWAEALRLLQEQAPGRRLLLKAPDHLGALADLLAAVPDATIAVCLRDPASTVPSLDSLLLTVHAVTARNLDPRRMSDVNLLALATDARRYMAMRNRLASRIVEIPYAEIRADAPRAAASLYERAGIALDKETERRFGDFAAANRQHSHGVHRYRPEDFGATAAGIRAGFGDFAELSAASAVA
ncbi:MAG: sulfotransferase [Hyphomicrobiales bacterium]